MLVLALDTATAASTAAVVEVTGDAVTGVAERRTVDPRGHGEHLAPVIAAVLAEADIRPGDLAAVVAGLGPGPFTGLRVGLVTAASMGHALGIPAYGVCSLDGLGAVAGPGRVLAATDARRREVYVATYLDGVRVGGPDVVRPVDLADVIVGATLTAPRVAPERGDVGSPVPVASDAAVPRAAPASGGVEPSPVPRSSPAVSASPVAGQRTGPPSGVAGLVDRAVGEGAAAYADLLGVPVHPRLRYPSVVALATLAAPRVRAGAPGEVLTPLYLRRPDAVEPAARKPVLA